MVNDLFSYMYLCYGKKLKCYMYKNKIGLIFLFRVDNINLFLVLEYFIIENKYFIFYLW